MKTSRLLDIQESMYD